MGVAVTVDDREPPAVVAAVRDHADVDTVAVERLAAGDLVVGAVGVERKTLGDYVSALLGRSAPDLLDQVRRLNDACAHSYLLLEDQFPADGDEGVPAAAVRGSAAAITARLRTPVVPCSDLERLVDVTVWLDRKHVEAPSTPALPPGPVVAPDASTAERIYGCIDGIGPEMAARLHEAHPSVADVVARSPDELMAVEGIGPRRANAIHAAFRSPE
jgi:ERCC4-type nuclease